MPDAFFSPASWSAIQQNLGPAVRPTLVALVAALVLTPLSIWVASRMGLVSRPDRERDLHTHAVPYLGGLAVYAAFALSALLFLPVDSLHLALLILCGLTAVIFLWDDARELPAWSKLTLQALIGLVAIVGFGNGFRIDFIGVGHHQVIELGWLAVPVTLFWILGMQNTVNLLDGVDGLAGGVVAIVALILLVAAAGRGHQSHVLILAGALAGACLGFLFFNFHPARVFMGDSGAYSLGLALALISVLGVAKQAVAFALVVPVLALAVPIIDTGLAIVRRRRAGVSIAHADSRHIHHHLLDFGLTQPEICIVFYAATAILGSVGLMTLGHKRILSISIVLMVVALSTLIGERLQKLEWRLGSSVGDPGSDRG